MFTNVKILDRSKVKAFADDKINMAEKWKAVFGRVENIALVTSIFSFSCNFFQKTSYTGVLEVVIVWERVDALSNNKFLDWSKLKAFADNKLS